MKALKTVESINEKIDEDGKELLEILAKDEDEQNKIIEAKIQVLDARGDKEKIVKELGELKQ